MQFEQNVHPTFADITHNTIDITNVSKADKTDSDSLYYMIQQGFQKR